MGTYIIETMGNLIHQTAFFNLTWGNFAMILVACVFLYLAIAKGFEPLLLLPDCIRHVIGEYVSGYHAFPGGSGRRGRRASPLFLLIG